MRLRFIYKMRHVLNIPAHAMLLGVYWGWDELKIGDFIISIYFLMLGAGSARGWPFLFFIGTILAVVNWLALVEVRKYRVYHPPVFPNFCFLRFLAC